MDALPLMLRFPLQALMLAGALSACSCPDPAAVRTDFANNRLDAARAGLDVLAECDQDNRHLYALERGIVELAAGNPAAATAAFSAAKRRVVQLTPYDTATWTSIDWWMEHINTTLRDETVADYPGRDFEQLMMYAFLSLSELLSRGGDAVAYDRQRLERQLDIQADIARQSGLVEAGFDRYRGFDGSNPKSSYRLVGMGDFLRGVMLEEHPTRQSAAQDAYKRAFDLEPDYPFAAADLARLSGEVRAEPGTGVVWVFTLTGRGPWLEQTQILAPHVIIEVVRQIWNLHEDRYTFPNISTIVVPELHTHRDNPVSVDVSVDGASFGVTGTITDVEATASAEFAAMRDSIVARAVFRRAVKTLLAESLKVSRAKHGDREVKGAKGKKAKQRAQDRRDENVQIEALVIDLALMFWTFVEDADLRSWSLLPARVQARRLELPPGEHRIELRAVDGAGRVVGPPQVVDVRVGEHWNSYVLGVVPTLAGGPPPITSDPARAAMVDSVRP